MIRIVLWCTTFFFCSFLAVAETVSISGVVKKTGTDEGIEGVKLSLTNEPSISTTSATDGSFFLNGNTASTILQRKNGRPIRFIFEGNDLLLAPSSKDVCGEAAIFSIDGKVLFGVSFPDLSNGGGERKLPPIRSGINIVRISLGNKSFTRKFVRINNNFEIKNGIEYDGRSGRWILAKKSTSSPVDTVKAEKKGYKTKKVPVNNYIVENLTINLDADSGGNTQACSPEALGEIAKSYLAAQKEGNPSKMPLASEVKYVENNKTVTADKSIIRTSMPVDFSLTFADVDSCRAFVEIISSTGSTPRVMMTWLKVQEGKITGVDAMVTTTGDFMFNAKNYLTYAKAQDWSILTESQKVSRQKLINGADAYLDAFKGTGIDMVPWGSPCERIEGGNMHVTPDCKTGMPGAGGITADVTNRRYAVDVDMGTVDVFCTFMNMPDSHMFRLIDGKIRLVHTLTVQRK